MLKTLGFTFLLCLLSGFAYADGVPGDPDMVVNDPICPPTNPGPCATIVSSGVLFTFMANGSGGGTTSFEVNPGNVDVPGQTFTTLDIETPGIFSSTDLVNCSSNQFLCKVSFIGFVTNIQFFVNPTCTSACGFAPGDVFTIDLDNPNTPGTGGWGADRGFGAIGNLSTSPPTTPFFTPEPSSALMLVTGAAALATRRKLNKRS